MASCSTRFEFNCKTLENDLVNIKKLGEGAFGKVYQMKYLSNGKVVAVKGTVDLDSGRREWEIGCMLGNLSQETPCFIKYFSSFECPIASQSWSFANVMGRDRVLFIEMEAADGTVKDLLGLDTLMVEDMISFVSEILIAVYIGRLELGFLHNDIGQENILFSIGGGKRTYQIGGRSVVCGSKYVPKLSDFGQSVTRDVFEKKLLDKPYNELQTIFSEIVEPMAGVVLVETDEEGEELGDRLGQIVDLIDLHVENGGEGYGQVEDLDVIGEIVGILQGL